MKTNISKKFRSLSILLLFPVLIGCSLAKAEQISLTANTSPTPSQTAFPSHTATVRPPSPTATPLPEVTPIRKFPICSALNTYRIDQLFKMVSNRFYPPAPGSDDPHQGVDLTELLPNSQIAIAGERVNAVLSGTVAGIINDRFPYGNTLLIEIPLSDLRPDWIEHLNLPTPFQGEPPNTTLSCPTKTTGELQPNSGMRSLYVLYAHLSQPPSFQPGDWIQCGWEIGTIGQSGNALNPHLHLEVRVGPAGTRFNSMSHYDASATSEEIANYCTWRVSGQFQLVDPILLFSLEP